MLTPARSTDVPLDEAIADLLATKRFGQTRRWYAEVGSTNAIAASWASRGAPEGALVGADHQTAGRGRYRRSWEDAPGLNLLCSLVLRPTLSNDQPGLVPLAAGVALVDAVLPWVAPVSARLKWPNDLLIENRKAAGILTEGQVGTRDPFLVLGFGVNVNQVDFPSPLADRATSLALTSGRPLSRVPLLAAILSSLEHRYDQLHTNGGPEAIRKAFEERLAGLGEVATVLNAAGASIKGKVLGVDRTGALLLDTDAGVQSLAAGEVTLAPPRDEAA